MTIKQKSLREKDREKERGKKRYLERVIEEQEAEEEIKEFERDEDITDDSGTRGLDGFRFIRR